MLHYTMIYNIVKRWDEYRATLSGVEDRLLTVQQVADRLQIHPETVRRWLREKRLHGTKLGSNRSGFRISESEVNRLVAGGEAT